MERKIIILDVEILELEGNMAVNIPGIGVVYPGPRAVERFAEQKTKGEEESPHGNKRQCVAFSVIPPK